ncbi:Oidioi.mRNA.OKI2018_I69.PAR.g9681.t1.cds [Oikopleura dioica]|uniref:Oidioi.mRNA.OKI2018_I69.PAR.g9681.t1.cds n=1 Tax=Oikopleura dioica TaxID=34765 RepID=A0ABN7RLX6_OIKDI|nr:Oidioi.mRNA.OKI2018_I69.PAR.g9681.t1.cds [Oikopleura dioica]
MQRAFWAPTSRNIPNANRLKSDFEKNEGENYSNRFLRCNFADFCIATSALVLARKSDNADSSPSPPESPILPAVITTWGYVTATSEAFEVMRVGGSAVDAITTGTASCERDRCRGTVGCGGSPDENGETTLDAMIMDGETHNVGAVGGLRRCKNAAQVARYVFDNTDHTLLVGDQASNFAFNFGCVEESLTSNDSAADHQTWLQGNCQPNYWNNVTPNPAYSCGPYQLATMRTEMNEERVKALRAEINEDNHDTIGMVALDLNGKLAAGTSTNGKRRKIAGRVGDSPIPGSGSYAGPAGGAAATGDGDIMMRFVPSYQAHENMRLGMTPGEATKDAMQRIIDVFPNFKGALIAMNKYGEYGANCHGDYENGYFPFMIQRNDDKDPIQIQIACSL